MAEPTGSTAPTPPPDEQTTPGVAESSPREVTPKAIWERIRRHKIMQWTLVYAAAGYTLLHATEMVADALDWPHLIVRILTLALFLGLPVVVLLAWYHGHKAQHRISGAELSLLSVLLVIAGSILWGLTRPPPSHVAGAPAALISAAPLKPNAAVASAAEPSIAVLPFVNMSADHDQEYFSDGLSEELLNQLAQLPNLRVIGRTSSFAFKGKNEDLRTIGETLGVDHILEGSVRKSGDRVRITAQLINPADGTHLWSNTYDRGLGDIFSVQEDIARTVASALRLSIGAGDLRQGGTRNLEAYDAFLRASAAASPLAAAGYYERAVQLDPRFTAAWFGLEGLYDSVLQLVAPERRAEWQQKEVQAADRVLALAPESPAAKLLMSQRELANGHFAQAERLLVAVQTTGSGLTSYGYNAYASFLMAVGRPSDALETLMRSRESEPLGISPTLLTQIAFESLGEYAQAEAEARRSQAIRGITDISAGMAALRAMARADSAALRAALSGSRPMGATEEERINAALLPLIDHPSAGLVRLKRLYEDQQFTAQPLSLVVVAQWAAYFGDPQLSLRVIRRIPGTRIPTIIWMFSLWRPIEKDMRRLPGFKDFVRELGLVDYWRTSGNWGEFCQPLGRSDFECM